ncbi:hypothetical protein T08_9239 [Trichinella sp. T8]|nr:hypothetical protein T08_9239 [Trichinella sp. T8]
MDNIHKIPGIVANIYHKEMKSIAEVLKGKIVMNTESAVCFKYAPVTSGESSLLPKNPGSSYY